MSESQEKTKEHIEEVRKNLRDIVTELVSRGEKHDQTKLQSPEVEIFEIYTSKLRDVTFGSEQYKQYLKEMNVALRHHYENNPHHPEHYINGIAGMSLIDLIEMFCDWKAATLRHKDGDMMKSIEINSKRFEFSEQLKQIFINTLTREL